jgi:hypothetical protein
MTPGGGFALQQQLRAGHVRLVVHGLGRRNPAEIAVRRK